MSENRCAAACSTTSRATDSRRSKRGLTPAAHARRLGWRLLAAPRVRRVLAPVLEPWLRRLELHSWEEEWAIERARSPDLLADEIPSQLEDAVTSGWIRPGSRTIDIGAGRGQVAAWLAARGFPVLAADVSEEATRLGCEHFARMAPLLEFRTLDASIPAEELNDRFDFLFDRGCYHVLPTSLLPGYLANVAAWARPGAGFLLISRRGPAERVPALFESAFEIVESESIVYARSTGALPRAEAPGTAFRMVRRR